MRYVLFACFVFALAAVPAAADVIINMPGTTAAQPNTSTNPNPNTPTQAPATNATNAPNGNPGVVPPITNSGIKGANTFPPTTMPNPMAPGFQRPCTKMWCREGLTINLPPSNTPGQYRFAVVADGERYTCTGSLPLSRCGTPSSTCDRPGIFVGENGCALPPQAHSFATLFIDKVPQQVEVSVTLPGRQPIHMAGPTMPQCFYPNGQQCDARPCCQAQVNVAP